MASIPLPALDLKTPQQPNQLEQIGQLLQLKNAMQNAPLQRQALQQQVQSGQLQVQQEQQGQQDQLAFRNAMKDPSNQGKTIGDVADSLAKGGNISQAAWVAAKKADVDQRTALATLSDKELTNAAAAHKQTQELYNNVMDMPDDQLMKNWGSIAQQYDAIPGNNKMPLDPNQPQTKDQLKQFGPLISMQKAYLDQAMEKQKTQAGIAKDTAQAAQATAAAQKDQAETQMGTGAMADSRYRNILMNQKLGRPVTPEDEAWAAAYKNQKTLVPTANFNLQNAGLSGGGNGQPSALAQAVASGQMKWGDVISPRTPMAIKQQFAAEVHQANPQFNSGDFTVEQKAREAFTSGNYSQQLTSINTAREHMKTFTSLANALDNGDVQGMNKIGNAFGVQFGSDKVTNFNIAKQAFSSEVGKAFAGASVAEGDRKEIGEQISAASSPAQLRGVAKTADALLAGKQTALQQTYKQSQQGSPNFGGGAAAPSGGSDPFAQFGGRGH